MEERNEQTGAEDEVRRVEEGNDMSEREEPTDEESVRLPVEPVEDLDPDEGESDDVKGGVYDWWKKTQ